MDCLKHAWLWLVWILVAGSGDSVLAQSRSKTDSLQSVYALQTEPVPRIETGLELCKEFLSSDPQQSIGTSKNILHLVDSLQQERKLPDTLAENYRMVALQTIGIAYSYVGDFQEQLQVMLQKLQIAQRMGDKKREASALEAIANCYKTQGHSTDAMTYFRRALAIAEETGDTYRTALDLGNIGTTFGSSNLDSTLWYYYRSLAKMQEPDMIDREGAMGWMMQNIGQVFENRGQIDSAFHFYARSLELRQSIDHRLGQYLVLKAIAELQLKEEKPNPALININRSIEIAEQNGFKQGLYRCYQLRSEILAKLGRFEQALTDQKKYIALRDSQINEKHTKDLVQQTTRYEYGLQLLADSLEFAKKEALLTERSEKQRISLMATLGAILLLLALAYSIFKGKKRSDELLLNILPYETARELKQKGYAEAKLIEEATVLFTDFKGFTALSEILSPKDLVADLNECFSAFDLIVEKYGLEKIKTIGDSYMAAGGLPRPNNTHAADVLRAAFEIRDFIERGKAEKIAAGLPYFEIRIGIHTGPVVAGIVGIKKFQYDIWGDTVNTASRMESSSLPGKINVSESTYQLVKDRFAFEYRGELEVKGKGKLGMYFGEEG